MNDSRYNKTQLLAELKKLRVENAQLKEVQKKSRTGSWQLDCLNNKLLCTTEIYDILGLDPILSIASFDDFLNSVHPDDRALVKQICKKSILEHKPEKIIHRILLPNGVIVYVRSRCEAAYNDEGDAINIMGSMQDIDVYKEAKLLLQQSTKDLQLTLDKRTTNLVELSRLVQDGIQQRIQIEEKLTLHRNILIAVANISQHFLKVKDWRELVEIALEQLGLAANVSRVYLFNNHRGDKGEKLCSQFFERCAEGIEPQIDNEEFQNIDWYAVGLAQWYETLVLGEVIVRQRSAYTQSESDILDSQKVLSLLIVPLFTKGHFWGFMGFNDCLQERDWSEAEIASLKSAAVVIGGAIEREQSERIVRENEEIRLFHAEKQRDELVREVHHRIKNHLHGLMGLLRERKNQGVEHPLIIAEAISQIESVAIVYGLQATHSNAQIYFSQMMMAIIHSATSLSSIPIVITQGAEAGSCEVDRSKAVALALVINEMLMNAIKHSQAEDNNAQIAVHHEHQQDAIVLSVSNAGHLPKNFNLQTGQGLGTGLELAMSMLPSQGAELNIKEKNNQVVASLSIRAPLLIDYGVNN